MDNNEFLSFFWNLSDEHSNEIISSAAEGIANSVESKQKFGKDPNKEINSEKYKNYLNICESPSEDILYAFHRIVKKIY